MAAHLHLSYYLQSEDDGLEAARKYDPYSEKDCPTSALNKSGCTFQNGSIGNIPTYFSIASGSLSILGSFLIFVAYFTIKGIRNLAQKIITLLALADFFTATGYLIADWNYLSNAEEPERCFMFGTVCEIQSVVTSWSSISSCGWTCALALHFYLLLSTKRKARLVTLLVWQNLVIWLFPLLIVLPLLCTNRLGYSPYATANWCFIRNLVKNSPKYRINDDGIDKQELALILVGGKLWELLSYAFVIVVYFMTIRKLRKVVRGGRAREDQSKW